jgi:hypothetical protein
MLFSFCAQNSTKNNENTSEYAMFIDLNQLYFSTILLKIAGFINHSFLNKKGPENTKPFLKDYK